MYQFLSGAVMMGCFVAALFFARSWVRTADRFFLFFAIAFGLLGAERIVLGLMNAPETGSPPVYLLRFATYVLIAVAILDKNRSVRRR